MFRNLVVLFGLLAVVGLISAVLTYIRAGTMSPVGDIQSKGLAAVQRGNLWFFGVAIPLLVAVIRFFVYRGILAHSPASCAYHVSAAGGRNWDRSRDPGGGRVQDARHR